MNNRNRNNPISGIARCFAFCLSLAVPFGLQAQDVDTANDEPLELEALVVEGYADSLRQSMQAKRSSTEVTDVILAEDIGQFPDENVAEALQRITGVQIQRNDGEGTYISVRGVEPGLNMVTVDGRTASSGGFERAFDFSTLSADLVSSLRVIKSQSADLVEGGIGAVVEIQTPKPLNFRDPRVARLTATFSHTDLADDWSNKFSGLFSQQFDDGKQGFLVSFATEDNLQRTDNFGNNGWVRNAIEGGQDLFTPRFFLHQSYLRDRERKGVTGAYQWQPSDQIKLTLSGNWNQYITEQERNAYNVNTPNRTGAEQTLRAPLDDYTFNENGTGVAFDGQTNQSVPIQQYTLRSSIVNGYGANLEWKASDRLSFEFDASKSESYNDSNPENRVDIRWNPAEFPAGVYSLPESGSGVPDLRLTGIDPDDRTLYNVRQLNLNRIINENEDTALSADMDLQFDEGFFSSFEAGVRLSERTTDRPRRIGMSRRPGNFPIGIETPASVVVPFPIDNYLDGSSADVTRTWMVVDQRATLDYLADQGLSFDLTDPWSNPNPLQLFSINEEIFAGYAKLNFETLWGDIPVNGNFGFRYADTSLNSKGASSVDGVVTPESVDTGYDDVLPSFTIIAKPRQDVVLRLAGASVMTRPQLDFLTVSQTVNLERVPVSINNGNPYLDPYRADQLDLSLEWYINDIDSFSLAFFYKDVESFVTRSASTLPFVEELAPGVAITPGEEVSVNRPENLAGDTVEGFEVAYQKVFANLPEPFDGLGITANYTYTKSGVGPRNTIFADADLRNADGSFPDSALTQLPLEGLSKHSYNLVGFYDKGPFSMRLAYNWRDRYLLNAQFHQNAPLMREEYGQWDGRIQYRVNEKIKLTLDAINLDESTTYEFYAHDVSSPNPDSAERIRLFSQTGRKINAGVTYSF